MRMPTAAALGCWALLSWGCASGHSGLLAPTSVDALPPNHALITFYRVSHFVGSVATARVRVNGKVVGEVSNGSALRIDVAAGEPAIVVDTSLAFGTLTIPLKVEPHMEYYVELAAQAEGAPAIGALPYILGMLKSNVKQYCDVSWCAGVIPKEDAVPIIQGLNMEAPLSN